MTRPSRIPVAVFLTSFDAGGTERQMTELVRRLDRTRFDVRVACFHKRGVWLPRVQSVVSEIAEFPIGSFRSPLTLARAVAFANWCRSRKIAIVQAADIYANSFALPAARLAGVPARFGSRREVHPTRGRGLEALQRFGYRSAHRIVTNSEAGSRRLQSEGIRPDRISVVRNGLDFAPFLPRHERPHGRRIVTVGRLRAEKAHEVLIAAVGLLREAWPDVELQIVGDGVREQALRELTSRLSLDRHVSFLGHREDVAGLLAEADVFVLPSRIEAAPNAALEAMAAGLPVVASDVGGIPEAITDAVTGLLVPPDNPDRLAAALFRIFDNPEEAGRMGEAARRFVQSAYSFERMVTSFEGIYLAQLARKRIFQETVGKTWVESPGR